MFRGRSLLRFIAAPAGESDQPFGSSTAFGRNVFCAFTFNERKIITQRKVARWVFCDVKIKDFMGLQLAIQITIRFVRIRSFIVFF